MVRDALRRAALLTMRPEEIRTMRPEEIRVFDTVVVRVYAALLSNVGFEVGAAYGEPPEGGSPNPAVQSSIVARSDLRFGPGHRPPGGLKMACFQNFCGVAR